MLFDAAHQCGIIAGKSWQNRLAKGAHLMMMSTYKSLGSPASGLIVSNDAEIMERIDAIAFPSMAANFDAAKSAALAVTMLDWIEHGPAYSAEMIATSKALGSALECQGLPVFAKSQGHTNFHQFAIEKAGFGGGQAASKTLSEAGFLAYGIGLPIAEVTGDMNGIRFGTPELGRWGVTPIHTDQLADLIAKALRSNATESLAAEVRALRESFDTLHFVTF